MAPKIRNSGPDRVSQNTEFVLIPFPREMEREIRNLDPDSSSRNLGPATFSLIPCSDPLFA